MPFTFGAAGTCPPTLTSSRGKNSLLRTIKLVKEILDAHALPNSISVYSEGNSADFAEISIPGIEISKYRVGHSSAGRSDQIAEAFLPGTEPIQDIDAIRAMRELIEADVLIMSKSSFSYCAGCLSDGIKIYEQAEGQLPLDSWLVLSSDGSFDCAAFEGKLSQLITAKHEENATGSSESL